MALGGNFVQNIMRDGIVPRREGRATVTPGNCCPSSKPDSRRQEVESIPSEKKGGHLLTSWSENYRAPRQQEDNTRLTAHPQGEEKKKTGNSDFIHFRLPPPNLIPTHLDLGLSLLISAKCLHCVHK